MNKIIYLGHYSLDNERKVSPAGNTMMNYVINVLENQTQELYIISIAQKNKNLSKEISNLDNKKIIYLPSYKNDGIFNKLINRYKRKRDLYNELNDLLEDGDILIVYHSLAFINLLRYIKNKKNVKLILQVCEIYADVLENEKIKEKEIKCIQQADKYIFSTNRLEEILNKKNKEFVICMGDYRYNSEEYTKLFDDNLIHVVYAGTFDPRKGGASTAILSSMFLNEKYHLHIIGFGSEKQVLEIEKLIKSTSKKCTCKLTYDGLKNGKDYIDFIKNCNIGLSTQNPDASFNDTSFPSKILSYMCNGLSVVSADIPVISNSVIGKYIAFYKNQDPKEIADAIMSIDVNKSKNIKRIMDELDVGLRKSVLKLLIDD